MTTADASTTHQGSFDEFLEALRNAEVDISRIQVPSCLNPEALLLIDQLGYNLRWILDGVAEQLKEQGIRFPKPLRDAMVHLFGREELPPVKPGLPREEMLERHRERFVKCVLQWACPSYIAEMLELNREFFEPVWRTGRFLPPFSIDFEDVSSKMQMVFLQMMSAAGIQRPGEYIYLSPGKKGDGYTDTLVLFIPISRHEVHMVAITVRRRRWYIPPSKAQENLNQLVRQVKGVKGKPGQHKKRAANETYVLIGRYTRGVKGAFRRKGYSRSKRAALVFDDRKRYWFVLLLRFLRNLFSKRLNRQEMSLGDRKAFGIVAERMRVLRSYLSVLDRVLNRAEDTPTFLLLE